MLGISMNDVLCFLWHCSVSHCKALGPCARSTLSLCSAAYIKIRRIVLIIHFVVLVSIVMSFF